MKYAFRVAFFLLLISVSVTAETPDGQLFLEAETRYKNNDFALALTLYDELISEYPQSEYIPDAQFRKAVSLYRTGKFQASLDLLLKVEKRYRSTHFLDQVPFWVAVQYYSLGKYQEALDIFKTYIQGSPAKFLRESQQYEGLSEFALKYNTQAIETIDGLIRSTADIYAEGYLLNVLCSLYLAEEMYRKILELTEPLEMTRFEEQWSNRLRLYRGEAFWYTEDFAQAEAVYTGLLNSPPDISSIAFQRLFSIYQRQDNREKLDSIVLTAENRLAGLPDVLVKFWLRVGVESFKKNKFELAKSYFLRIWRTGNLDKLDGLVPLYLADIYYQEGDYQKAVETLEAFRKESKSQAELILYRLAVYYYQQKQYAKALPLFTEFLQSFPNSTYYGEAAYLEALLNYIQSNPDASLSRILDIEKRVKGGAYSLYFLRLKSVIFKDRKEYAKAIDVLREYTPLNSKDVSARVDLIQLYFLTGKYTTVNQEAVSLYNEIADFQRRYWKYHIMVSYLQGLAYINERSYEKAREKLSFIQQDTLKGVEYELLYPYVLFYKGWIEYKLGKYTAALGFFTELIRQSTDPFAEKTLYLAGWCAYLNGQYVDAEYYFNQPVESGDSTVTNRNLFMKAKSLIGQGKNDEAIRTLDKLAADPKSSFADDALYEEADLLSSTGHINESSAVYRKVYDLFPASNLAEESMYKRGEILYFNKLYSAARDAFREYRIAFPRGLHMDAALYWGGMASFELGEEFGAVLLWEKLMNENKESTYRSDAIMRSAEIYNRNGNIPKALELYQKLVLEYPNAADTVQAGKEITKLLFIQLGQSEREAELTIIINSENKTATAKGRAAMLELSRMYIYTYPDDSKLDLAQSMLIQLVAKKDADRETAAQAQYLLGEYYYKKQDFKRASEEFRKGAEMGQGIGDLRVRSFYRVAEMEKLLGNKANVLAVIDQMTREFKGSDWVQAAAKLAEGW